MEISKGVISNFIWTITPFLKINNMHDLLKNSDARYDLQSLWLGIQNYGLSGLFEKKTRGFNPRLK